MSDHESNLVDGLLEHLQAVGGGWSSKLTMERLAFAKIIAELEARDDQWPNQIAAALGKPTSETGRTPSMLAGAVERLRKGAIALVDEQTRRKTASKAEVEKLTTQIKLNVDYATQCATVEKERDKLRQGIKKYLSQFPDHDQGPLELWQLVNGGATDE